ncbi:outer membrane protein TolC [Dysgonomonadaceae bacterium PH5-43]|nr:outer membrane protein TolC [Dysgonomonadaceae bacterium PH5-43]
MNRVKYILASICLLVTFNVSAQQAVVTLQQCRTMALENNKKIAIASENKTKAEQDVKAYRTNYLPKLSASGNYLFTTSSLEKSMNLMGMIPLELDLQLNNTYVAGISLEQPIYMGGKITSAYKMAKIGEEIAELNEQKTQEEVILLADEAYWTYVQTLELTKTVKAYKSLIEKLLSDVENAYNAGMKPRNDLLKVQVSLNEAELQLLQAENGVTLSRMNLCHTLGLSLSTELMVEDYNDKQVVTDLPTPDVEARPEYSILNKQIDFKSQQVKLVRSEFLPNVGVMGNFGYANGLKFNNNKLLDKTAFSAVVSVNIPIFRWGESVNKVRSAKAEKNMAILQRDELSEQMELELQQAINTLDESVKEITLAERSLVQAEENMQESRNRYDAGLETMSDYLEAQTLWQQANFSLIKARTSSRLAETKYLKAAGKMQLGENN